MICNWREKKLIHSSYIPIVNIMLKNTFADVKKLIATSNNDILAVYQL